MLREIYCEKFAQKKIEFKEGLNVVLGTNTGDNSIGKSTLLLIVDFVFGGSTYAKSADIMRNVGEHDIFFSFQGKGKHYYYARNNVDATVVWICDENYNKIAQIDLKEYKKWLDEYYQLQLPALKFRDAVSRYIRVYGKDNYFEKRPLTYFAKEKDRESCYTLLKLFDGFTPIAAAKEQADKSKEVVTIFNKARTLSFIENIGAHTYSNNKKEISKIENELINLSTDLDDGVLELDSVVAEQAIGLKGRLTRAKRRRGAIFAKLRTLDDNFGYEFSFSNESLAELQTFFPGADIQIIDNIEKFHMEIAKNFRTELRQQKAKLLSELNELDVVISDCESELKQIIQNPNLSKRILQRHADLVKGLEKIKKENESFEKYQQLTAQRKLDNARLQDLEREQFARVAFELNTEMARINDYIYDGKVNSPVLVFEKGNYQFFTPDDTGTGRAYKGLAVFDLAVLNLTKLPILVHDSIVLKQISDDAIEKILEIYCSQPKQIIISLDKADSYSGTAMKLLESNKIIELAPNGRELFGRAWGTKKQ